MTTRAAMVPSEKLTAFAPGIQWAAAGTQADRFVVVGGR